MRTKSLHEPLYLNLYNFENLAAKDYPYVLTSPRSLQACRKAGYKPVELLQKSIQDYQEDLGEVTPREVHQLYAIQEQHRLSKLETCRAIRKELITLAGNTVMKENVPLCNKASKNHKNCKEQLDKENSSSISTKQSSRNAVINVQENAEKYTDSDVFLNDISHLSPNPQQCYKVLCLTEGARDSRPLSSDFKKKKPSSVPLTPSPSNWTNRRSPCTLIYKKRFLNLKNFSVPTIISSVQTGSLSSNNSTSSTLKSSRSLLAEHTRYAHLKKTPKTLNKFSTNITKGTLKSLPGSGGRECIKDCISVKYDSNNNNSRSLLGNSVFPKRKQVSFSYLSTDDLCLSEHDRRILESMALKKELERESDEFAHQAHLLWEQDREEREQLNLEQAVQWREYVVEKRRIENAENTRKWEEMKVSLRKSQLLLEANITEKEKRYAKLRKAVEEQKLSAADERGQVTAKRRAETEAAHQQLELETVLWQQNLDQQQKQKLEKAESSRLQHQETYHRRVASANRVEELHHQERWQQVKEETEAALYTLREMCRVREQRAQERYQQLLQDRDRQLKGQSLERAIKFQQVRELHDELEHGLQMWQDQVLALQWEAAKRAGYNASKQMESKRQRVETENKARQQHHIQLMERICREEEARVRYVRELIARKEEKMKRMAQERDLSIRESRLQAQNTADLREHLRHTLSPETFDRKVARVAFEMRIAGRPPTASPTMTRSHIFLG